MSKYGKLSLAALTAIVLAGSAFQARTAEPAAGSETAPAMAAAPSAPAGSPPPRGSSSRRSPGALPPALTPS